MRRMLEQAPRKPVREQTWLALYNAMEDERRLFTSKYASLRNAMKTKPVDGAGVLKRIMDRSISMFHQWEVAADGRHTSTGSGPPTYEEFDHLRDLLVNAVAQNIATLREVQDRVFFRNLSEFGFGALDQDSDDVLPAPTPKEHQQAEGRVTAALLEGKTAKALALGGLLVAGAVWWAMRQGGGSLSAVTDEQYMEAEESFSEEAFDFDQEATAFDPDCNTLKAKLHRMRIYHRRSGRDSGIGKQLRMREAHMKKLCKEPRTRVELNGVGRSR